MSIRPTVRCDRAGPCLPRWVDVLDGETSEQLERRLLSLGWLIRTHRGQTEHVCPLCRRRLEVGAAS